VGHADARAACLDDELLREQLAHGLLVGVAEDGVDGRAERPQLLEHRDGRDVAAVEDQVGCAEPLEARLGDPSRSPRQVRVGDRRDEYGADTTCALRRATR
jgi:hypothetical protein